MKKNVGLFLGFALVASLASVVNSTSAFARLDAAKTTTTVKKTTTTTVKKTTTTTVKPTTTTTVKKTTTTTVKPTTTTTVKKTTTTTTPVIRMSLPLSKALDMGGGHRPIGRGPVLSCVSKGFDLVNQRRDAEFFRAGGLQPKQTTVLPISKPPALPYVDRTWQLDLATFRTVDNSNTAFGIVLWACLDNGNPYINPATGYPFYQYSNLEKTNYGFRLSGLPVCGLSNSPCVNSIAISGNQPIYTGASPNFTYPDLCKPFGSQVRVNSHPSAPWFDKQVFEGFGNDVDGASLSVRWVKGGNLISAVGRPPCDDKLKGADSFRTSCANFINSKYSTASKEVWNGTFSDLNAMIIEAQFPKVSDVVDSKAELVNVAIAATTSNTDKRLKMGLIAESGIVDQRPSFKTDPRKVMPNNNSGIADIIRADQASNVTLSRWLDFTEYVPGAEKVSWLVTAMKLVVLISNNYNDLLMKKEFVRTISRTIGCQWVHAEVYGDG